MNDKNHLDVITDYVSLNDLGHFSSVAVIFFLTTMTTMTTMITMTTMTTMTARTPSILRKKVMKISHFDQTNQRLLSIL